jgi:hypothetical protein
MAHRGRRYPVHFRRDWNQNGDISNAFAIAENYRLVLHLGPGVGGPLEGAVFVLTGTTMPNTATLQWRSENRRLGTFDYFVIQQSVFGNLPDTILESFGDLYTVQRGHAAGWRFCANSRLEPFKYDPPAGATVVYDTVTVPATAKIEYSRTTPIGYSP